MRPSEQSHGDYTLFFNADNVIHRFRITSSVQNSSRVFHIGGREFTSIVSIIDRYMNEEICEGGYRLSRLGHQRAVQHSPSPLTMCTSSLLNVLGLIKQQTSSVLSTNSTIVNVPSCAPLNADYLNIEWSDKTKDRPGSAKMSKSMSAPLNPQPTNGKKATKKKLLVHSKSVVPDFIHRKMNGKHDDGDSVALKGNLYRYSESSGFSR